VPGRLIGKKITMNIGTYNYILSFNSPIGKAPTFSHHIPRGKTLYLLLFPHHCPHVPYISGSEKYSLSVNATSWTQDEDCPHPAIHCRSCPAAICR